VFEVMQRSPGWKRSIVATLASLSTMLAAAAPASGDGGLPARIDALEHQGDSRPREAAEALEALLVQTVPFSAERQHLLTVRGLLLAQAAEPEAADRVAQALDEWARARGASDAAAAALLVRARALLSRGNLQKADTLMTEAMARLPEQIEPAARLRFLLVHGRIKNDAGKLDEAARLLHEALTLADALGTDWQRAELRSRLAYVYYQARQLDRARSLNAEALDIATHAGDHAALGHAHNTQVFLLDERDEPEATRREMEAAIDHARRAGAKQDESLYLANLADFYLKSGQYRTALTLSEQALPLARELKDLGGETVALANIGLAHISMKDIAGGKSYVAEAIAIDERRGSSTGMSATLAELGLYLEKAGDVADAVQAYHRHRRLADEVLQRDQQKAILELQERFDAERRAKDLALLNSENDLKSAQLRRRDLQQRLWWLLAATCAGSIGLLGLLYRRVRRSNHALESTNRQLLVESERDPLTGLPNRRHFQAAMQRLCADGTLAGTVFLVDIDHFKRINDTHGHSTGDGVLTEIARRLRDTLREDDLIVRWGGEEFLVVVRALAPEQVEALARRMLGAMAGMPVRHEGHVVELTGSIGFATFPMEPTRLPVSWERAINLVDTAMYLAKAHGRNRAYGVRLLQASDESRLDEITRSLEAAWRQGEVTLTLLEGPGRDERAAA
jgi:diguanylate cyclase (GGDEF)-like protein